MAQPRNCPICSLDSDVSANESRQDGAPASDFYCPRCGGFSITHALIELFQENPKDRLRPYLASYTRQLNQKNVRPELLTLENWQEHAQPHRDVPMSVKRERLLLLFATSSPPTIEKIEVPYVLDYPLASAVSAHEASEILLELGRKRYISGALNSKTWNGSLTPDGVEEVERIQNANIGDEPPAIFDTSRASKARERPKRFDTMLATYYRVGIIGEGGSGFVDKVKDESGKVFALKMLKPDCVTSENLKRFKNEVYFCLRPDHTNIVQTLDFGFVLYQEKKCPFYVMQLYDGTLRALMTSRIDSDLILPYFRQILDGVQAIHKRESYHRDLKPENILFDKANDTLIVADLGIAHFQQELLATAIETNPRTKLANFQYAAPEQRSRTGEVDHRADIFALGLMLNEMFTGKIPQGHNYATIAESHSKFEYLDYLVELMIDQNPSKRPHSIEQIKKQLDE